MFAFVLFGLVRLLFRMFDLRSLHTSDVCYVFIVFAVCSKLKYVLLQELHADHFPHQFVDGCKNRISFLSSPSACEIMCNFFFLSCCIGY